MPLPDFHRSAPFTLGIELELQVVNPPGSEPGLLAAHRRREKRPERRGG